MGKVKLGDVILSEKAVKGVERIIEKLNGLSFLINGTGLEIWGELGNDGALIIKGRVIESTVKISLTIPPEDWGINND